MTEKGMVNAKKVKLPISLFLLDGMESRHDDVLNSECKLE